MSQDILFIIGWWAVLFLIGAAALPLTRRLFSSWWDQGYLLSKAVGLAGVTFITWYLGSFKLLPFTQTTILISLVILFGVGVLSQHLYLVTVVVTKVLTLIGIESPFSATHSAETKKIIHQPMISWKQILILELFFFIALFFWSYIKSFEPDIRGLEKFMDYGFAKTISNSSYFPPPDMWYAGGTINYYYFGHTMMALVSKLSSIDLAYGYNLMLATLFALCFTMSFGISWQLLSIHSRMKNKKIGIRWYILVGILGAYLVTMAGNMQTIYAFTKGYNGEDTPPPFWTVLWPANELIEKIPVGLNTYWYANATRFIPFTIHEFPSYSFVVSDNHGHVLSIPFALLAISSLLTLFGMQSQEEKKKTDHSTDSYSILPFGLYGMLGGILLMTNALDGPIYMGFLTILLLVYPAARGAFLSLDWLKEKGVKLAAAVSGTIIAAFPFLVTFTSFANGLAINCPPKWLENTKIGPIIFETVDKCQKSPMWMVWLLWGFFFFGGIALIVRQLRLRDIHFRYPSRNILEYIPSPDRFLAVLFIYCVALIFFAEFFYFKDIYPAHFRSNTMFKLGYQAFMMCSLMCGYVIITTIVSSNKLYATSLMKWGRRLFFILLIPQLFLVSIFPFFSVRSYFGALQTYKGLYGLTWFENSFPDDFKAMNWLSKQAAGSKQQATSDKRQVTGGYSWLENLTKTDSHVHANFFTRQLETFPVIIEADGDSYTDFDRMSAFAGMPTVIGWGVHEWLWRGTYDVVAPRRDEVAAVYESPDQAKRMEVLNKYNVTYIVVGQLERQKFTKLNETGIMSLSHEVFRSGNTVIYQKNS